MAGSKNTPQAPEGAVAYEKDGQYRFAYSPADVVKFEFDGFAAVNEKAEEKLLESAKTEAGLNPDGSAKQ